MNSRSVIPKETTSMRLSHEPCLGVKVNSKRLGTVAR
jgi:hypothetical protein